MKWPSIPLVAALLAFLTSLSIRAQTLEQQFQSSDAELNRVYKVYRASLPEDQKAALRVDQMQWLAQMEEALKTRSSADDKLKLRISLTATRIADLTKMMAAGQPDLLADLTPQQRANRDHNLAALRKADDELNAVYQQVLGSLPAPEQEKLRREQREWLARASGGVPFGQHRNLIAAIGLVTARTSQLRDVRAGAPTTALDQAAEKLSADSPELAASQSVTDRSSLDEQNTLIQAREPSSGAREAVAIYTRSSPDLVTPVPQLPHSAPLSCASVSVDNRFVVTGDSAGTVKVWSIKTGDLVKSLQVGSIIVSARLSPDMQTLYAISKERREAPLLHSYDTTTWLPHLKTCLITTDDRAGEAFISQDCSYVVITGDFQLERGEADVFSDLLQQSRTVRELRPHTQVKVAKLSQLFPELRKTPNCFDQFGTFYGGTLKSCVYNDGEFSVEQSNGLEWILKRNDESLLASSNADAFACVGLSLKQARLLAYNDSELRTLDLGTLSYSRCLSPGGAIRAAICSPKDDRLAVVTQLRKDSIQAAVLTPDGLTLEKKEVSSSLPRTTTFDGSEWTYSIDGIAWIKDSIFVTSGEALTCFTDKWDLARRYAAAAVSEIASGQAVVISPLRGQTEQVAQDYFDKVSVQNYPDRNERAVLAYSCEAPTCKVLYPFDVSERADRIAKGYWWRGGGGFFVGNANSVTKLDAAVNDRAPDCCAFLGDNLFVSGVSEDGSESTLTLLDTRGNYQVRSAIKVPKIGGVTVDKPTAMMAGIEGDSMVASYKIEDSGIVPLVRVMFGDGGYTMFTSDLHYLAKGKVSQTIQFGKALQVYPFEQFDLRLNRPDIVLERLGAPADAVAIAKQLREKRIKRMGVTEEMLKPDFHVPELEIVGDVPSTTEADEISLAIKANDSKYPLERLKVFVNNVPVNGRDGESLRDKDVQSLERTIPIKLAAGRNKIQVSVLNNAGAESLYANAEVNCTAQRPKPTLYAVAMGVSEYSNSDWNLKYAAKDARDVLARLKDKCVDQYGEIKELLLTDKDVTKENLLKVREFLKSATIDDTVLMFAAGHGLLDSKYDYYFGTTDIDFNNPSDKGIAFEEFDDLLAELPSLKKSLLIDTCHAGELDEEEKTLLASASGTSAPLPAGNGLAMRSIGTRGMNVRAIEGARGASEWYDRLQGLFVDLRRGSGSTILSSSAGAEYALESSEQQNGLFTYAVLEALEGKPDADTNKDGSVQMSELGEYVKKRVSELTNNKQTPNTRRVNLEGDFTLAKTK